jgi:uncharacterized protein YkwD
MDNPSPSLKDITTISKIEFGIKNEFTVDANYYIYLPFITHARGGLRVNPKNRQESLDFFLDQYMMPEAIPMNWTGTHSSCNPGTTDQNFQQAVLRRINYFRAMAGVPADITFTDEYNRRAQAAALMMSVNGRWDHYPTTDWICYSTEGADAAGDSLLFYERNGWRAISGYIADYGSNNTKVGHRRYILNPQLTVMGTGDIPKTQNYGAANALLVFTPWSIMPPIRDGFIAWPPPGYVPYHVVYPRWSFTLQSADLSGASVIMNSNGIDIPIAYEAVLSYILVWNPLFINDDAWFLYLTGDTKYTVTIQNIMIGNRSTDFSYDVVIFDPNVGLVVYDPFE